MNQTTAANVSNHYRYNRETYDKIESKLSNVREKFDNARMSDRISMLRRAHWFAVLSTQTQVSRHERAYKSLVNHVESGKPPAWAMPEVINDTNYYNNKAEYIMHAWDNSHHFDEVCRLLDMNQVDKAHRYLVDNIKGVSTMKSAFMLAMLGYTEKMCIDTNVSSLTGIESPNTVVIDKYESACDSLKSKFSSLSKTLSPFMFQWVMFDYQRGVVSEHDVWFDSIEAI
jgi:thermostable 8-oxoguanine DNA glycosylase